MHNIILPVKEQLSVVSFADVFGNFQSVAVPLALGCSQLGLIVLAGVAHTHHEKLVFDIAFYHARIYLSKYYPFCLCFEISKEFDGFYACGT